MNRGGLLLLVCACAAWAADTNRGALLLEDAECLECHTIRAQGAGHEPSEIAPELGAKLAPAYTAPALASAVWNHTPAMLAEMSADRVSRPPLIASDWEDLFAYLYSVQFSRVPRRSQPRQRGVREQAVRGLPFPLQFIGGPGAGGFGLARRG